MRSKMTTLKSRRMVPLCTPVEIQLQPTNRCNANCRFCWRHDYPQEFHDLPDEKWFEIADEICSLGAPQVTITGGGEPLLRSRVVLHMVEKFSRTGIEGSLITNGMLITEEVARRIVELQWKSVQVSIHAPTAQLNDVLMGREGAFNLALRGIENLNRCKRLLKSALPKLAMRIVLTPSNFFTLPEFIKFAHFYGASQVFVRLDNRIGTDPQSESALSKKDRLLLKGALERASKVADELEQRIEVEFDTQQLSPQEECHTSTKISQDKPQEKIPGSEGTRVLGPHCPVPFSELMIFANGMASPCCEFIRWQFKSPEEREGIIEEIGNRPLSKTWQEGFSLLRSSMFAEDRLYAPCKVCSMDMRHRRDRWPESFFNLRFGHLRKHKGYKEGIQFGLEQLKEYPDSAVLHYHIGEFYMELEEYNKAIPHLSRGVELDQKREWTHFKLGKCHFKRGQYAKAIECFRREIKHSSSEQSRFHSWHFMAICHERLRNYAKMRRCFNKAKTFTSLYGKEEIFEGDHLRTFIEGWPAVYWHREFHHLRNQEEYKKGISFGLAQLKEHGDSAVLYHHLGEFHMELEEYDRAIERLSKAVRLDQKMEWTHFSLGKCFYLAKRYNEAEKAFRDNIRLTSERLSHYHSWLFLAMAADARNDQAGCRKALNALKGFREFMGKEIPLEQEFLTRMEHEKRLPAWLKRAEDDNSNRRDKSDTGRGEGTVQKNTDMG